MPANLPSLQDTLGTIQENLSALTDSLNLCLGTQFQLKLSEPIPCQPDHPELKLQGIPGLCVVFKPADEGGYVIVIPETLPLPAWYREPDETEESRLQTLAMEWNFGTLPDGFQDGTYSTVLSDDLEASVSWPETADQAQMLEIQLIDQQTEQASAGPLWLIGPLNSLPLDNEQADTDQEPASPTAEVKEVEIQDESPGQENSPELDLQGLDAQEMVNRVRRLLPMTVTVSVRLAEKKIELSQLQNLGPGTLITFPQSCDDLLGLYVNNKLYAQGEAVKIGEKFGLKVNEVGTIIERPPGIFTL
ncbi:MAG: FliM/FliN family flagellar motor switch protein [Planctomycetaceae bacterium]|nr:FliM/FliN family flagellar motor switch protein [Planctomycetaceae bacterium]